MRLSESFPTARTHAALLLTVLALRITAMSQEVPCVDPALTQTDLVDQLNPRTSGDLAVLLNLPHVRLYCSPIVSKFFVIGDWSERHQLVLNESRPFSGSAHPEVASHSAWQAIDVTEASRRAEFDFLVDESRGLAKDTEYFVALSGCDTLRCRTAGFVKVTPWKQAGGTQNLIIIAGCGGALGFVIAIIIIVWLCRLRRGKAPAEDTKSLESKFDTYLCADRVQVGRANKTSNDLSEADSGLGGLGGSNVFDDTDSPAAQPPVQLTTFTGGQNEPENTYDEIGGVVSGHLDEEENAYDEIDYTAAEHSTHNTAANSANGPTAAGMSHRTFEASGAVANSAYAQDAENSTSAGESEWKRGTENQAYGEYLYREMLTSKNDVERPSGGTSNPAYEIQGNPELKSVVNPLNNHPD